MATDALPQPPAFAERDTVKRLLQEARRAPDATAIWSGSGHYAGVSLRDRTAHLKDVFDPDGLGARINNLARWIEFDVPLVRDQAQQLAEERRGLIDDTLAVLQHVAASTLTQNLRSVASLDREASDAAAYLGADADSITTNTTYGALAREHDSVVDILQRWQRLESKLSSLLKLAAPSNPVMRKSAFLTGEGSRSEELNETVDFANRLGARLPTEGVASTPLISTDFDTQTDLGEAVIAPLEAMVTNLRLAVQLIRSNSHTFNERPLGEDAGRVAQKALDLVEATQARAERTALPVAGAETKLTELDADIKTSMTNLDERGQALDAMSAAIEQRRVEALSLIGEMETDQTNDLAGRRASTEANRFIDAWLTECIASSPQSWAFRQTPRSTATGTGRAEPVSVYTHQPVADMLRAATRVQIEFGPGGLTTFNRKAAQIAADPKRFMTDPYAREVDNLLSLRDRAVEYSRESRGPRIDLPQLTALVLGPQQAQMVMSAGTSNGSRGAAD